MATDLSYFGEVLATLNESQRLLPIVVDEVQKIPGILDAIHLAIERDKLSFILCGSSARKLRKGQANLLGGRAWRFAMLPLSSAEIPNFDLLSAINTGLLPQHYGNANANQYLRGHG